MDVMAGSTKKIPFITGVVTCVTKGVSGVTRGVECVISSVKTGISRVTFFTEPVEGGAMRVTIKKKRRK